MNEISIDAAAALLRVHKSRIEQWISRNQFLPALSLGKGKRRLWSKVEVIRLAIFVSLVDEVGMSPETAGYLTQISPHGFKEDGAYFVCYHVNNDLAGIKWGKKIIQKSRINSFLETECPQPKILMSGYSQEALDYNRPSFGPAQIAIILDLDIIEARIEEGWASE